jgi:hypothetical protein
VIQKAKPRRHVKAKYRSGLEDQVAAFLLPIQKELRYEKIKIEWEDLMYRSYTPDFVLDNGIIVEVKGLFDNEDRRKHLAVKKQHPELDIRFVFSNSKSKLYKGSKTCYCDWCDKNGFQWANRVIPQLWLRETGTAPVTTDIKLSTPKKEKL